MKCIKRVTIESRASGAPSSTFTFLDDDKEVIVDAPTGAFETGKDYSKEAVKKAASDPDNEVA